MARSETTSPQIAERSVPIAASHSPLIALCVISFFAPLLFVAIGPFLAVIADDLDSSVPAIGQAETLRLVISAALGLVAGPVADRSGYRLLLTGGMICAAMSFMVTGLAPNYPLFMLTSIPAGLAGAVLFGLPVAYAANRYEGDDRRRAISWIVASLSGSAIVGVPVLTTVETFTGWRGVFLICAALSIAVACFVFRSLPFDRARPDQRLDWSELVGSYRPLIKDRRMALFIGSNVLRGIGWLGFVTYVGAYFDDDVGLSTQQVGLIYLIGGSAYFTGSLVAGRGWIRSELQTTAAVMTLGMGVFTLVSLLAASSALIAAGALGAVAFAGGVGIVLLTTVITGVTPARQGATMTLNSTMQGLGNAIGVAYGGVLIALGGYELLGFGLAVVLAIAAVVLFTAGARTP